MTHFFFIYLFVVGLGTWAHRKDSIGTKVKIRLRGGRAPEEGRVEVKIGDDGKRLPLKVSM